MWLKDDGRYGDGPWGGNKVRKLEWILPDARRSGRETILTFGALGTNHGLATALYAREHGLRVALALVDQPLDDHVRAQLERLRGSGATLHFTHDKARTVIGGAVADGAAPALPAPGGRLVAGRCARLRRGRAGAGRPRSPRASCPSPRRWWWRSAPAAPRRGWRSGSSWPVFAAGSSASWSTTCCGSTGPPWDGCRAATARLLRRRGARLPEVDPSVIVTREWLGAGYGHATPESSHALALAREREGLELDPVYTAKAMAGALALLRARRRRGRVLFLQTHGARALSGLAQSSSSSAARKRSFSSRVP